MKRTTTITILSLAMAACSQTGTHHNQADAPTTQHDAQGQSDMPITSGKRTIFTIVMENHDYAEIIGSTNAPFINGLLAQGGLATAYKDTGHPSLPNYLNMISGANQYPGIVDLTPTFFPFPVNQPNLGTQMTTANVAWRAYAEDMGTPCTLSDSGNYATKHEPFLYFTDMQMAMPCAQHNVDFTQNFTTDLAANTYSYMWITPNLLDDGHDPSTDPVTGLKQSDTWASTWIPQIMNSPGYKAGGVIFITWDEAEGRNGDDPDKIPMIILSPKIKQAGMTSATAFTHTSYTATVEDMLGMPRLMTSMSSNNLMEFVNW
jgi:hypothetical protein